MYHLIRPITIQKLDLSKRCSKLWQKFEKKTAGKNRSWSKFLIRKIAVEN